MDLSENWMKKLIGTSWFFY